MVILNINREFILVFYYGKYNFLYLDCLFYFDVFNCEECRGKFSFKIMCRKNV